MSDIHYNVKIAGSSYEADAVAGDAVFEIKKGVRESKRLNGTLFELAQVAAAQVQRKVILVLEEPVISTERIAATWMSVTQVLRDDLVGRMAIWIRREDNGAHRYEGHPAGPSGREIEIIEEILKSSNISEKHRGPTHGDSLSEVLRLLLYRWLLEKGPITLIDIGETLGYTFKPVRAALDELNRFLKHHGKKGVELAAFPRDAWTRLVHNSASVRGTLHFTERGQSGRSSEALLRRYRNLNAHSVAVGGVEGARHYCPSLDLVGLPRLDLCVHSRTAKPDLEFIRSLDPGLERATSRDVVGSLAVHFLYRKESLFNDGWADPVECLLDLHEMRLESQALQFLRSFPAASKESF